MATVIAVRFTGTRQILFPYRPESGVVEQISWRTNVMRSRNQTEQRHALRVRPRQSVEFTVAPEADEDVSTLRTILFDRQAVNTGVPQWWDIRYVNSADELPIGTTVIPCNPDDAMFAAAAAAMIVAPDGTAFDVVIDSVQAGVSVTLDQGTAVAVEIGSAIVPLGAGHRDAVPIFNDALVNHTESRLKFLLTSSEDIAFTDAEFTASAFTKHPTDGKLVLDTPNVVRNRFRHRMDFEATRIDNAVGLIVEFPTDVAGTPRRPNRRSLRDVTEIWQFKKLMYWLRGSWQSFYMPTFRPDLVFNAATFDLNDSTVVIKDIQASRAGAQAPHRDVYLTVSDGRTFTRRITGIVDNGDGTETVSLASSFEGFTDVVNTSDLVLSWAELVRIDGDVVTFVHERPGKAEARFNVRGVVE